MVPRPSTGCQWLLERTLLVLPQKEMELGEGGKGVSEGLPRRVEGVARPECYIHSRHVGDTEKREGPQVYLESRFQCLQVLEVIGQTKGEGLWLSGSFCTQVQGQEMLQS